MMNFRERLYEALLFSFGKILAKYNIFAQNSILRDVGKEIIEYLNAHGFEFKETNSLDDVPTLMEQFCQNGFVDELEIESAEKGAKYIWKNIYGFDAYRELLDVSENPFLSCPLNASLYYLADKHGKTLKLHKKSFDTKNRVVESQEEIVDKQAVNKDGLDSLVVENARLYELAEERANKLQKALDEIKVLRGLLPICSNCKKIRNEAGNWRQFEAHITDHSEAEFSHCICPDCAKELYPEIYGNRE